MSKERKEMNNIVNKLFGNMMVREFEQYQMIKAHERNIRLEQTKKVFEVLAEAINNGSISYRDLIYDKLDFKGYYDELISGLTITNAIVDLEEKDKIIDEAIEFVRNGRDGKGQFYKCCVRKVSMKEDEELLEILERGKNEK